MSEKKERDRRCEEALTEKKIREECDRLSKVGTFESRGAVAVFAAYVLGV